MMILSLQGYSLSGHCTVLLLSTLFDHYGSPSVFWILWLVLGGLSAMKMVQCLTVEIFWTVYVIELLHTCITMWGSRDGGEGEGEGEGEREGEGEGEGEGEEEGEREGEGGTNEQVHVLSVPVQVGVYMSRTWSLRDGAILAGLSLTFHYLSMLYLRLQYQAVYVGMLIMTATLHIMELCIYSTCTHAV